MNIFFFTFLSLTLFIFQTVILPSFSWFNQCFDLLIILVLYLSLISNRSSILFAIIFIGAVMDSISGVPFFYHILSYLWIYIIVLLVKQLLFQRSLVFILIISIVSVLIQHGLLLLSIFIQQGQNAIIGFDYGLMVRQMFWGLIIIPPCIWFVNVCRQHWNYVAKMMKKEFIRQYKGEL